MLLKLLLPCLGLLLAFVLMAHMRTPTFAVPLRGGDYTPRPPSPRPDMPALDRAIPAKVQTATFAMG